MAKLSHKELTEDELAKSVQNFVASVRQNFVRIAVTGGLLIVVVATFWIYRANRQRVMRDTSRILDQAAIIFDQLPGMLNEEARTASLESMIAELQNLAERYPDSPGARTALYFQGNCYFYMDDIENAERVFREFIAEAQTGEESARGEIALGYTLENKFYLDDTDMAPLIEATARYEAAANEVFKEKSYLYYNALLNAARVLEVRSQDAGAMAIYQTIMDERRPPRGQASELEDDDAVGGGLQEFLERQVRSRMEPLSFYITAKVRSERLEATSKILTPGSVGSTSSSDTTGS